VCTALSLPSSLSISLPELNHSAKDPAFGGKLKQVLLELAQLVQESQLVHLVQRFKFGQPRQPDTRRARRGPSMSAARVANAGSPGRRKPALPTTPPVPGLTNGRSTAIEVVAKSQDEMHAAVAGTLMRPEVGAASAIEVWQPETQDVNALARELAAILSRWPIVRADLSPFPVSCSRLRARPSNLMTRSSRLRLKTADRSETIVYASPT
jgi:hypothetical protein